MLNKRVASGSLCRWKRKRNEKAIWNWVQYGFLIRFWPGFGKNTNQWYCTQTLSPTTTWGPERHLSAPVPFEYRGLRYMAGVEIAAAVAGIVSAVISVTRIVVETRKNRKEKQQRRQAGEDTSTSYSNTSRYDLNEIYTPVSARNEDRFELRDCMDLQNYSS